MRQSVVGAMLGALLSLLAVPAQAVPVTYDFAGVINGFSSSPDRDRLLSLLPGTLGAGTDLFSRPMSGSFTVDADVARDDNPNPRIGSYGGFDVISAFSLTIEGFTFALDTTRSDHGVSATVFDLNDDRERLEVNAFLNRGLLSGPAAILTPQLSYLYLGAVARDLSALASDQFPTDLTLLADGRVSIDFFDFATGDLVGYTTEFGSLTRRVSVPESGTALLFGLGLLSFWYADARRRRRSDPR